MTSERIEQMQQLQAEALMHTQHARRCLMDAAPRYTHPAAIQKLSSHRDNARLAIACLNEAAGKLEALVEACTSDLEQAPQKKG